MLKPKFHSIFDDIAIGMQMLSDNLVKEDEVVSNIEKDNQDNVPPLQGGQHQQQQDSHHGEGCQWSQEMCV